MNNTTKYLSNDREPDYDLATRLSGISLLFTITALEIRRRAVRTLYTVFDGKRAHAARMNATKNDSNDPRHYVNSDFSTISGNVRFSAVPRFLHVVRVFGRALYVWYTRRKYMARSMYNRVSALIVSYKNARGKRRFFAGLHVERLLHAATDMINYIVTLLRKIRLFF